MGRAAFWKLRTRSESFILGLARQREVSSRVCDNDRPNGVEIEKVDEKQISLFIRSSSLPFVTWRTGIAEKMKMVRSSTRSEIRLVDYVNERRGDQRRAETKRNEREEKRRGEARQVCVARNSNRADGKVSIIHKCIHSVLAGRNCCD